MHVCIHPFMHHLYMFINAVTFARQDVYTCGAAYLQSIWQLSLPNVLLTNVLLTLIALSRPELLSPLDQCDPLLPEPVLTRSSGSISAFTCSMCVLQVFYPDADDVTAAAATCDPWHGQVADILSHDGQGQGQGQGSMSEGPEAGEGEQGVQADPYGCGDLWERFLVHWQPNTQVGLPSPGRCHCSKGKLGSLLYRIAFIV